VIIRMVENVQQITIKPFIEAAIAPGTCIYTDEYDIYKQNPQNSRRNALPTERINGPLVMCHEHLTCALIELMQIT
jgi:hypothetical protein